MTAIEPNRCRQIEAWLGRPLTESELRTVESLQELTDEQLAVVAAIQPRNLIAPLLFLQAVVPSATTSEIRKVVDGIDAIVAARHPAELANLPVFERYAGRPLSADEKATVATLEDLSTAHRAIAATLARQEHAVAVLYHHRIVRSATAEAYSALLQHLVGHSDA